MIPRLGLFTYTTSAADDATGSGSEYRGRLLAITWLGWTVEFTLTRKARP